MSAEKALFTLVGYRFTKALLDLSDMPNSGNVSLSFEPSGVFNPEKKSFDMVFRFTAKSAESNSDNVAVEVLVNAQFVFKDIDKLQDIPDFFYPNAIAILFPYVRAFVSTLTLQANVPPFIIPTMNLVALKNDFKRNTRQVKSEV